MAQPVLSVGDAVCIDGLNDARFGTITAISRLDPPSYTVELHEGTIEYNVACERLTPAAEAPLRIGDKVIVDAATPYQRHGVIIAIRRSMPPKYVVEFDIGLGRRRSEFDIDRSRLRISGPGGYSCAVM